MKNFEQQIGVEKKFVPIQSGRWTHEVTKVTPESITIKQTLDLEERKIEEIGSYVKKHIDDLNDYFYILDSQKSTPACLPHGQACYLEEWDIILVRTGLGNLDLSEPISKSSFTILAHELGHKYDHLNTDPTQMKNLSYAEKEIRAWKIAKEKFGENPKFDNNYADDDIASYEKN